MVESWIDETFWLHLLSLQGNLHLYSDRWHFMNNNLKIQLPCNDFLGEKVIHITIESEL